MELERDERFKRMLVLIQNTKIPAVQLSLHETADAGQISNL